jgi:hypothetical protein
LDNSTLFTLETNTFVQSIYFFTINDEDVVAVFKIDLTAGDGATQADFLTCQPSFSEISETTVNASFSCIPELDPRGSWYMDVGVYSNPESNTRNVVEFKMLDERRKTKYVNLTIERGTANANIVSSKEVLEKMGDFLFLYSSLTFLPRGLVASTIYKAVHDISKTKTEGDFRFLEFGPNLEVLEGEPFTVICDSMGRNPPPVTVQKDGGKIRESAHVSHMQLSSHLWSSSYVTFRHASIDSKGSYSCMTENNGKKVVSQRNIEVELNPRIRWDLSTASEDDPSLVCDFYGIPQSFACYFLHTFHMIIIDTCTKLHENLWNVVTSEFLSLQRGSSYPHELENFFSSSI